jgi:hypothetical protein
MDASAAGLTFRHRLLLLIGAPTLSACGTGEARNLHLDDVAPLVVEEEMRLGDANDPDLGFTRPGAVAVDRDGAIYVLEVADRQIRVYAPEGRLLRRIGGSGDGPGEFRGAPRFGVVGDTVWTWDSSAGRITLFDRAGTVLSTGRTDGLMIPIWGSYGWVFPRAMRDDGLFTGELSRVGGSRNLPPSPVQDTDTVPVPRVLFDASGRIVDTIGWDGAPPPQMARPPSQEIDFRTVAVGGRRLMVPSPPAPLPRWEALHDGRLILEQSYPQAEVENAFTITRLGLERDTVFHHTYHYAPLRYLDEELDSIAYRTAHGGPGLGVSSYAVGPDGRPLLNDPQNVEPYARALRAEMDYPPFRLPIQGFQVGNDESLWLLRDTAESPLAHWVLLDREGLLRGRLELPRDVRPLWMEGDTFWAVVPDELEVPWVVRYRIRPTG